MKFALKTLLIFLFLFANGEILWLCEKAESRLYAIAFVCFWGAIVLASQEGR